MKLCKDCKHARRRWIFFISSWEYARCAHHENQDPVTGDGDNFCKLARHREDNCGKSGKYFEAKS